MRTLTSFFALVLTSATSMAASLDLTLLDREGHPLPDAVVVLYAVGKPTPAPLPASASPQVVSQEKMKFSPEVTVTAPGATLRFSNLDRWDHHVRGALLKPGIAVFSDSLTEGFDMYLSGRKDGKEPALGEQQFSKAGVFLLGCHLHVSMRGFVFVTDSAWTLKSDGEGKVRFEGLPAQAVEARVWHPDMVLEGPRQAVKLTDTAVQQTLAVDVLPRRRKM